MPGYAPNGTGSQQLHDVDEQNPQEKEYGDSPEQKVSDIVLPILVTVGERMECDAPGHQEKNSCAVEFSVLLVLKRQRKSRKPTRPPARAFN